MERSRRVWLLAAAVTTSAVSIVALTGAAKADSGGPSGGWHTPVKIGASTGSRIPTVTEDASGESNAIWTQKGAYYVRSISASNVPGPRQLLFPASAAGSDTSVQVYASENGYDVFTSDRLSSDTWYLRTRTPTGSLGPLDRVLPPNRGRNFSIGPVVVSTDGEATALLATDTFTAGSEIHNYFVDQVSSGGTLEAPVQVAESVPSGPTGPPEVNGAYPTGFNGEWVSLAPDGSGQVALLWSAGSTLDPPLGTCCEISMATVNTATDAVGSPVAVTAAGDAAALEGAFTDDGALALVWSDTFPTTGRRHLALDYKMRTVTPTSVLGPVRTITQTYPDTALGTSGTHLDSATVSPSGHGALVAQILEDGSKNTHYRFTEEVISPDSSGHVRTIVSSRISDDDGGYYSPAPIAWTGQIASGGGDGLATWEVRQIDRTSHGLLTGLAAQTVERSGQLGPVSTPFRAGDLNGDDYAATINNDGRQVIIAATTHGLMFTSRN
jgi:hypothetical protein